MPISAQTMTFTPASEGAPYHAAAQTTSNRCERKYSARPVDLVHLARQSLGDRVLEIEILGLFKSQSELYIDRLANAGTSGERKMAAHTILGSARGIGAWKVAEEAQKIELSGAIPSNLTALRRELDETNAFIAELLVDA